MNTKGFFAYSTHPASSGDAIELAVKEINQGNAAEITTWRRLRIGGRLIIKTILEKIDECDFFCADLTGMNDNVLFEIGYAIGKKKPIWLIFDPTITEYLNLYKEFQLLTTLGYSSYTNTKNIVNAFYYEEVHTKCVTVIDDILKEFSSNRESKSFLYLKSQVTTNTSQEIVNQYEYNKLTPIVDDASENRIETLTWYIENISKVPAVLAEFSTLTRSGHKLQNSKCAFISGLSIGLGKKVLMVAERPYDETPMDYRDLLRKYNNRDECSKIVKPFFEEIKSITAAIFAKERNLNRNRKLQSILQKINFGEFTAEHESEKIYDYYIETSHIETLVRNEYSIIVGRKGSGKTAALYYLNEYLNQDKRNFVCLIKPVNFEIEGVVKLLETLSEDFEQGYVIEAVWKFLVYTEIGKTIYDKIIEKQKFSLSDKEQSFIDFIEQNKTIFGTDFSTRLEEQIEQILENRSSFTGKQSDFRIKISEYLHNNIIYKIREFLADVIGKNEKIIVLIDNLDKSWRNSADLKILSKYILGLLGVTGRIAKDLSIVKTKQRSLNFSLILFLRSDIFKYILQESREPDKIEVTKIKWDDPELFFRIIEERFVQLSEVVVEHEDLWSKYCVNEIDGISIKNYIIERVYPRPRDIIFFFRRAKEVAVSRGHSKIESMDIRAAYTDYSSWVFQSLIVENGVSIHKMKDFMYHLAGGDRFVSRDIILGINFEIELGFTPQNIDIFIDHLVNLSIVGREIRLDDFRFEFDMENNDKFRVLASKISPNRLKIHPALYPYLEIQD